MEIKKTTIAFIGIAFGLTTLLASADDTPVLKYIEKTSEGTYIFHTETPIDNVLDYNLYYNDKVVEGAAKKPKNGAIEVSGINKVGGDFFLERRITSQGSGGTLNVDYKESNALKIRSSNDLKFIGNGEMEFKDYGSTVVFKLNRNIFNEKKYGALGNNFYQLNINGKDYNLEQDDGIKDAADKCYIIDGGIRCAAKFFDKVENPVILKIDGFNSNSISVTRNEFKLEKPISIETNSENGISFIKFTFNTPKNLLNLNNIELSINGNVIDSKDVSMNPTIFTIRYNMGNLSKTDNSVFIRIKDVSTNASGSPALVDVSDYANIKISKAIITRPNKEYLDFDLKGMISGLYGDIYRIKIVMNDKEYSYKGIQEAVMENGKQKVDQYGNPVYIYKNKINVVQKFDGGFQFSFKEADLQDGENIFYIKNENSQRESNKVSFKKGNYDTLDYNYSTGTVQTNIKENIQFENGFPKNNEKISFMNTKDNPISLGKMNFNGLKDDVTYSASFTLASDLKYNPFTKITINDKQLTIMKKPDGKLDYSFLYRGAGRDLKSSEIIANLNDIFNLEGVMHFELKDIKIQKLMPDSEWKDIYNNPNKVKIGMSYLYDFGNCYDGEKDFCSLSSLKDPYMQLSTSFGGELIQPALPSTDSADAQTMTNKKQNIDILELQFKNEKNKVLNEKLKKFYDLLLKKNITSRQKNTLKSSINGIIKALKDIEDNNGKSAANKNIKENLVKINGILRSLKK